MSQALKLRAETKDDLVVISSTLQDAILKVGEISYDTKGRFLNLRLSRFKHENQSASERVQTGLRIDSVLNVKSRQIDRSDPEAFAVLLSVNFEKASKSKTDPSGVLQLVFAGGGEMNVDVECIEVMLADVSTVRVTDKLPLHSDG